MPRHCGLGSGRIALRRQVLVDEGNIGTIGVTIASRFVQFGEGAFVVTLTDVKGASATGRFSATSFGLPPAVDPASVPASFDGAARDVMTCGAMVEADRRARW